MEFFGDLSSYNAAATLRVTTILNSLDQMLYRIPESHRTKSTKVTVDDARARSIRNPLLLMFRRACECWPPSFLPSLALSCMLHPPHILPHSTIRQIQQPRFS
jgi:hypothetical protein